ncbi:hypothetical protein [Oleiharenicola lentus]|uniref:hypothetical protein n=1 Tax=Oleiharenicola lentus TaxID=2508720 RepID=UPI003F66AF88
MPKYNSAEWDEVRKKFSRSIMADTSLVSLAQNVDTKEWPHTGEEEKPSKYIDFTYDELLMMPEIAGKTDRVDHLIEILKETLAFDDPFGDMVAQVEDTASRENPILKTLARLNIPEGFPLILANFSEGTRMVCTSEGIKTIGEFADLGQKMSTRVVLGGDFRNALNALTHGDEDGIAQFLPYRKGFTGLHLAESIGLVVGALPRSEQLALARFYGAKLAPDDAATAKPLGREQCEKLESSLRPAVNTALDWFKDEKAALVQSVVNGGTFERYFVVLNDPVREVIASRLTANALKGTYTIKGQEPAEKKAGFFGRLFGKR